MKHRLSLPDSECISFGYITSSGISGSHVSTMSHFLGISILFSIVIHPHQQCTGVPPLRILTSLCQLVFLMTASLTAVRRYLFMVLICISLMPSKIEHLFICLLAFFFSVKRQFESFDHFSIALPAIFLLVCRYSQKFGVIFFVVEMALDIHFLSSPPILVNSDGTSYCCINSSFLPCHRTPFLLECALPGLFPSRCAALAPASARNVLSPEIHIGFSHTCFEYLLSVSPSQRGLPSFTYLMLQDAVQDLSAIPIPLLSLV